MAKQLIVVSPPGERLTIKAGTSAVDSLRAVGDQYSHVVVEADTKAESDAAYRDPESVEAADNSREPPLDITMSLVGGLPDGFELSEIAVAETIKGPLTLETIKTYLAIIADGGKKVIVLKADDNG